jgi:hypothetical protein
MSEDFWAETEDGTTEECTERARDALNFIVAQGGVTSRWRSISITTDMFGPHRAVIDFLGSSAMPALRYLELTFRGPSEFDDEDEFAMGEATFIKPIPLLKTPPPHLHTVKLQGVPNPFLFGHPTQPSLSGLTRLELAFVKDHPDLSHLSTLLAANPQLFALSLNMDMTDPFVPHKLNRHVPKIQLPNLRELALLHVLDTPWPLNVMMMIDAPNVDYLSLNLCECDPNYNDLLHYIANGGNASNPRPLFPSVTHLMVCLNEEYDCTAGLRILLAAHTKITLLDLLYTPTAALLAKPWLVPNLEHLRVAGCRGLDLKKVVSTRARAKLPLKVVEVDALTGHRIKKAERKYLKGKVDFGFIQFPEGNRVTYDVETGSEDEAYRDYDVQYVWD